MKVMKKGFIPTKSFWNRKDMQMQSVDRLAGCESTDLFFGKVYDMSQRLMERCLTGLTFLNGIFSTKDFQRC